MLQVTEDNENDLKHSLIAKPSLSINHHDTNAHSTPYKPASTTFKVTMSIIGTILCISTFIPWIFFNANYTAYTSCAFVILALTITINSASCFLQRRNLSSSHPQNKGIQSQTTNIALLFMAALYYAISAPAILLHGTSSVHVQQSIFYLSYIFILGIFASHFVGGLKWGRINHTNEVYAMLSVNWWCCMILMCCFFNFMANVVITPWFYSHDFIDLSQSVFTLTGEFVHSIIFYFCRPAVTVTTFRIIEQIMHTMQHAFDHKHAHGHGHTEEQKLRFSMLSSIEFLVISPFILLVVAMAMICLTRSYTESTHRVDLYMWACINLIDFIWSFALIVKVAMNATNKLSIKRVGTRHFALILSAMGMCAAQIGTVGVYSDVGPIWIRNVVLIMDVLCECVLFVMLSEIEVDVKQMRSHWITAYGKFANVLHFVMIICAFLGEAQHLEHFLNPHGHHDENDVWAALEFVLYFWNIEYHLACIERINFVKENKEH